MATNQAKDGDGVEQPRPLQDTFTSARLDLAQGRLRPLFPESVIPVTDEVIKCTSRRDWVTRSLAMGERQERQGRDGQSQPDDIRDAWLPTARRKVASEYLGTLAVEADFGFPLSEGAVRRAAGQGWVLRELEARERAATEAARKEKVDLQMDAAFISRTRAIPADGHGDWYAHDLPRELPAAEVTRVLTLARRHPDDLRAQDTACQVIAKAASLPLHLDATMANASRIELISKDGVEVVLAAMRDHQPCARLQWRACEALWRITETAGSARMAEEAGAVEAIASAMHRFPRDLTLIRAASGALANIARHCEAARGPMLLRDVVGLVAAAMQKHPRDADIQVHACAVLWQLAMDAPTSLATRPGLRCLVEHAATSAGAREARCLLERVQWRSEAEAHVTRGAGRQRWGQWAAGRRVPA